MRAQVIQYYLATVCAGLVLLASVVACGSELSEAALRNKIAPSVVRVRDEFGGGGSGFLVEGGYIVTAAHVVWPGTVGRIMFNDGTEHKDVPIVSYDLLADLAFLGPVATSVPHLKFADVAGMQEGNAAFSAGYPKNGGGLAVDRGAVVLLDQWGYANVSHVSSTAKVGPGMSGGPTTNDSGEVIGS